MITFETERLHLDGIRDSDFDILFELQTTPDALRFYRQSKADPAVVRSRMADWARYALDHPGLGVWAIRWKETGAFAGYGVLRHVRYEPGRELEVGYSVAPEFRRRGIAREFTRTISQYALNQLQAPRVVAYTDPGHTISQRVLEKCGFVYDGTENMYADADARYVLDRSV
jgi:RimJ/RimL family protein N-acetyltransferase